MLDPQKSLWRAENVWVGGCGDVKSEGEVKTFIPGRASPRSETLGVCTCVHVRVPDIDSRLSICHQAALGPWDNDEKMCTFESICANKQLFFSSSAESF